MTNPPLNVTHIYKASPASGPASDRVLTLMYRGQQPHQHWFTGVRDTSGEWFFDSLDDIVILEDVAAERAAMQALKGRI